METEQIMRPEWIMVKEGWKVNLRTHDTWFHAEYKRLRQNVLDCHPDRRHMTLKGLSGPVHTRAIRKVTCLKRPHSTTAFRSAREHLAGFLKNEEAWYNSYGIDMPIRKKGGSNARKSRVGRNHLGLLT